MKDAKYCREPFSNLSNNAKTQDQNHNSTHINKQNSNQEKSPLSAYLSSSLTNVSVCSWNTRSDDRCSIHFDSKRHKDVTNLRTYSDVDQPYMQFNNRNANNENSWHQSADETFQSLPILDLQPTSPTPKLERMLHSDSEQKSRHSNDDNDSPLSKYLCELMDLSMNSTNTNHSINEETEILSNAVNIEGRGLEDNASQSGFPIKCREDELVDIINTSKISNENDAESYPDKNVSYNPLSPSTSEGDSNHLLSQTINRSFVVSPTSSPLSDCEQKSKLRSSAINCINILPALDIKELNSHSFDEKNNDSMKDKTSNPSERESREDISKSWFSIDSEPHSRSLPQSAKESSKSFSPRSFQNPDDSFAVIPTSSPSIHTDPNDESCSLILKNNEQSFPEYEKRAATLKNGEHGKISNENKFSVTTPLANLMSKSDDVQTKTPLLNTSSLANLCTNSQQSCNKNDSFIIAQKPSPFNISNHEQNNQLNSSAYHFSQNSCPSQTHIPVFEPITWCCYEDEIFDITPIPLSFTNNSEDEITLMLQIPANNHQSNQDSHPLFAVTPNIISMVPKQTSKAFLYFNTISKPQIGTYENQIYLKIVGSSELQKSGLQERNDDEMASISLIGTIIPTPVFQVDQCKLIFNFECRRELIDRSYVRRIRIRNGSKDAIEVNSKITKEYQDTSFKGDGEIICRRNVLKSDFQVLVASSIVLQPNESKDVHVQLQCSQLDNYSDTFDAHSKLTFEVKFAYTQNDIDNKSFNVQPRFYDVDLVYNNKPCSRQISQSGPDPRSLQPFNLKTNSMNPSYLLSSAKNSSLDTVKNTLTNNFGSYPSFSNADYSDQKCLPDQDRMDSINYVSKSDDENNHIFFTKSILDFGRLPIGSYGEMRIRLCNPLVRNAQK